MSATLRRERAWRYVAVDPTAEDVQAGSYVLARSDQSDGAYWVAYAPQNGRESTVALRRTAIGRAVFTVAESVPVEDTDLWRLQRNGVLYTVTGLRPVPMARQVVFDAETVERGVYAIAEDVPEFTASDVYITPAAVNLSVGTVRVLRATVVNGFQQVLPHRPIEWRSQDNNTALVDAQGRLEGVTSGQTTVEARSGGAVGTITVTVF